MIPLTLAVAIFGVFCAGMLIGGKREHDATIEQIRKVGWYRYSATSEVRIVGHIETKVTSASWEQKQNELETSGNHGV